MSRRIHDIMCTFTIHPRTHAHPSKRCHCHRGADHGHHKTSQGGDHDQTITRTRTPPKEATKRIPRTMPKPRKTRKDRRAKGEGHHATGRGRDGTSHRRRQDPSHGDGRRHHDEPTKDKGRKNKPAPGREGKAHNQNHHERQRARRKERWHPRITKTEDPGEDTQDRTRGGRTRKQAK